MKKIYYILTLLVGAFMASCSPQQDQIFEESSSQRITRSINEVQSTLSSAKSGWLFQYFPGKNQQYGGFNMVVNFMADGTTTVYNPYVKSGAACTSLYTVKQYGGVLVSFDTQNEALHYFSDPINPDGLGAGSGKGLEGDFEFVVISSSPDKVVLRGIKSSGICILTAMTTTKTPTEYLNDIQKMQESINSPSYDMYVGGQKIDNFSGDGRIFTGDFKVNGVSKTIEISSVATVEGLRFYKPVTFDALGKDLFISNFKFDAKLNRLVCSDPNVDVYIQKTIPPANIYFATVLKEWGFSGDISGATTSGMSASFAADYTQALTTYGGGNQDVKFVLMGKSPLESFPGFVFGVLGKYGGAGPYFFAWKLNVTPVSQTTDRVSFTFSKANDNAAFTPELKTLVDKIISKSPYIITIKDLNNPNSVKLVSVADSNYWYELGY